jgi:DNA-binding NarL/FixJ family response regulator
MTHLPPVSRLVIATDDPVLRALLEAPLSSTFDVVGVVADSEMAVELATRSQPDAAVVDVDMAKGGGMRTLRGILEVAPDTAIVVLSGDESDMLVRQLRVAGATA